MGVRQSTKSNPKFKKKSLSVRRTKLLFFVFVQLHVSATNIISQSKVKNAWESRWVRRNVSDLFWMIHKHNGMYATKNNINKHKMITNYSQQDVTFLESVYFYRRSTCFRRVLRPSSGAHNCTYSFRYCQPMLLLSATVEQLAAVLVDNTWSCMYSYVLLMMGGGTAWNMKSVCKNK
jgi:hypothetical protein